MVHPQHFMLLVLLASLPRTLQSRLDGRSAVTRSVTISTFSTTTSQLMQRYTSQDPEPTTTSAPLPTNTHTTAFIPNPTTTSSTAIPTKTEVKDCHVQGVASDLLKLNVWGRSSASDPLACQLGCMYVSQCEAYSFQAAVTENNCVFYHMFVDGREALIPSKTSGIFFSDKYPHDGSNFCYGNSEL